MRAADTTLISRIHAALRASANPEQAKAQQRYMKSPMPFLGLRVPEVRSTVKQILQETAPTTRESWEATIRVLWDSATHREERYAALAIARHRSGRAWQDLGALELYRHLIRTGAWWDFVDEIASHLVGPILLSNPATVTPVIHDWATDPNMWIRRAAILSQLRAKDRTDTALLEHCLTNNLEGSAFGNEFFIRKALGWALREFSKVDQEWVANFVAEHEHDLSPLSIREGSKYL